jgi:signal transduction histidine kinase
VRRAWALSLNLAGLVLVALDLAQRSLRDAPAPIVVAAWAGWSLWLIRLFVPDTRVRARTAVLLGMIAGGSLAGAATDVVGFAPAAAGLIALAGTPAVPLRVAGAGGALSLALVGVGALIEPAAGGAYLGLFSLLVICALGGLSRRQTRIADAQSRALLEERAQVAALSERSRIARDLHDVLAHSLGGLVIQLEAVDALLESGRAAEARDRVRAARTLAVSGLHEAKQAVTALREPAEPLSAVVAGLAAAHRAIGGQVTVRGDADRGVLTGAGRTAVRRAVQELLSNARRHAPGAMTTLDLDWAGDMLTVTASTPAGTGRPAPSPGGGHGLDGMRERAGEAGGTMTVRDGPPFVVELRLPGKGRT